MSPQTYRRFATKANVIKALLPHTEAFYRGAKPGVLQLVAGLRNHYSAPVSVTCAGNADGAGSQIHAVISVQAFCASFGIPYVHTPLVQMDHTSGPAEVLRWETTFNLGAGFPKVSETAYPVLPGRAFAQNRMGWKRPCVVALNNAHAFTDRHPEAYKLVCARVRENFLGPGDLDARADELRVGIHIRRGDVTRRHAKRYTGTSLVAARIARILELLRPRGKVKATVFSQGDGDPDFQPLADLGCEMRCDDDPVASLRALALSDVLLTAKSSFSYVAGLASAGTVLYEPFWHSKLPNWVSVDDTDGVCAALSSLVRTTEG